jgi:hypothetical protein
MAAFDHYSENDTTTPCGQYYSIRYPDNYSDYSEPKSIITIEIPRGRRPKLPAKIEERFRQAEIYLFFYRLNLKQYRIPDHVLQIQPKPHKRYQFSNSIPNPYQVQRTFVQRRFQRTRKQSSQCCKSLTFRARRAKKQESRQSQNPVAQCFLRNRIKRTRIFRSS